MQAWGLRITTYLTNALVLIGYALLYNWLQDAKFALPQVKKWRQGYLIGLTIAFLLLFHFASIFSMAQADNARGVGWTYINFQTGTVLYALLSNRKRLILYSLGAVLLVWYWWLPRTPLWLPYFLISMALMVIAQRFGPWLGARAWRYYPFALMFAAPIAAMNYVSLDGIDVGWVWQVASTLGIFWLLWLVHYGVKRQHDQQHRLRVEARVDELTGVYNYRVFNEDLQAAFQNAQQDHDHYSLYTLDIDHFKTINDRYGHLKGNEVLQQVAACLDRLTREMPYGRVRCYRTGGEEFSFIIEHIVPSFAIGKTIAWQVHDELGALQFRSDDGEAFGITISLGEDRSHLNDENYLDVYYRADQFLYASKQSGRNTVTLNGQTLTPPTKN